MKSYRLAVLIPCLNEEITIGKVISDCRKALPDARIYVFDNNSMDETGACARKMGAQVVRSTRPGKGNVLRHMFQSIDADIYILIDGDDTYPADSAPHLVTELIKHGVDMVVGSRATSEGISARKFHLFGNRVVAGLISWLFSSKVTDVLSGYRVFSKAFVKSVPLVSKGFEIETEMTLQAMSKDFPILEVPVHYGKRPVGSYSKLNTFTDGLLVIKCLFVLFKDYKPLLFFTMVSVLLFAMSLAVGFQPIRDYILTRYVFHVPLAILATGLVILSALSLCIGMILDTITKYHRENFELFRRIIPGRRAAFLSDNSDEEECLKSMAQHSSDVTRGVR